MEIIHLTDAQLTALYPCLKEAFPPDELKPLSRMLSARRQNAYDCLGLTAQDELVGYALFVRTGRHVLLDYFSVLPAHRNHGVGAAFLQLLSDYFLSAESVLVEVEDPAYAQSEQDRQLQQRRLDFYLRNGFVSTGVQALVFGVQYLLLTYGAHPAISPDEVKALYRSHYRAMLPATMYKCFIRV